MQAITYYSSPIGLLELTANDCFLSGVCFVEHRRADNHKVPILEEALQQLHEYFNGKRLNFDIPLHLKGTDFQKKVWTALQKISYGDRVTYKDIAIAIGNPKAFRAVGNANNKNKLPIIIPCHRVIGSNHKLIGYEGGLWRKQWLLDHEKAIKKT